MARRKSVALQKREYDLALARENYYKTKPASTLTTVKKREMDSKVYASPGLKTGANSSLMIVPVSKPALTFFGGTTALGLRDIESITDSVAIKPRNFQPAHITAMVATATPTAKVSPWGSRVIKYSAATTGTAQSHYSAPISGTNPLVTADSLDTRATAVFNAIKANLGDPDYAKFYLHPERFTTSKN
jgi:hypothetical protein